jgi:RNA polymerase sigma factor (sigma-70 family)
VRSSRKRRPQTSSTWSTHRLLLPVVNAALRRVVAARDQEYEDLLQSALEAVVTAMREDKFRGDSSLSTWASRIARNVALNALRARSRERRVFAHEADTEDAAARSHSSAPNPEKLADARERLSGYHEALRRLSPSKAQVVYLCDVLGHGLDEVAVTLGISVAAAQSRLVRGRKEISEIVASLEQKDTNLHVEEHLPRSGDRWRAVGRRDLGDDSDSPVQSCASSDKSISPKSARPRVR